MMNPRTVVGSFIFVLLALCTLASQAMVSPAWAAGLTINFTLPAQKYVTIAIDDARGNRVRNLISEQLMPAGKQSVAWDGLDDYGQAVPLGTYHWKGLYRDAIHQVYKMSAYDANASVPWFTTAVQSPTDTGWLSDHNPTWSACAAGDKVFLGAITSENGQDMMALDLTGKKLWGISHPFGVGAMEYAYDGRTVYAAGEGQWAGANAYIWTIDPTSFAVKEIAHIPSFVGLRGMVVKNGLLYVSCELKDGVLVIDPTTGNTVKTIPLPHAGGIAMAADGTIYAISGASVVVLTDSGPGRAFISDHLTRPNRIAISPVDGKIYISDGPTSWYPSDTIEQNALYGYESERFNGDNQIKEFDAAGRFIRAIGTPGGRHEGPWDPQAMRCPVGVTVDSTNHIWVAEWDLLPKRISVWTPDGSLYKEFIGAHKYGGGGTLDPADRSTLIYDGNMMTLNWETAPQDPLHSWKFDGTLAEIMPDTSPNADPVHENPTRMMHYQGHAFLVGGQDWDQGVGGLFYKWDGKHATPCAYIGPSPVIAPGSFLYDRLVQCVGPNPPGFGAMDPGNVATPSYWGFCTFLMTWTDANGDGKIQPSEVTFTREPFFWLQDPAIAPSLDAYIRDPAHRGVTTVWKIPMTGLNAVGAPVWDVTHITKVADRVPNMDIGGSYCVSGSGRVLMSADPIYGIDPVHHTTWTYKNDWPDTGGGAPKQKPGLVIAGYGVRGVVPAGGEVGNIFAISSDFGQWYLFTGDGLFLSTIFGDCRTAPLWVTHFKQAVYNMQVDGTSLGQESFSGSINQGSDGNVYIVCGHPHLSVVQLTGLDSVHRISGDLDVTGGMLSESDAAARQAALADRQTNGAPKLKFWTDSRWEQSPFHPIFETILGGGANQYGVWPHYDDKYFYIGAQLHHFSGMPNNDPLAGGDRIVIDLATTPGAKVVPGAPHVRIVVANDAEVIHGMMPSPATLNGRHAVLYAYTGGASDHIVSSKPLEDAEFTTATYKTDMGPWLRVSVKIPWADIGVTPPDQTGVNDTIMGDIGIVVADPYGGPARRYQFGDKFATLGGASEMKVDTAMFAALTRQQPGE